MTRLKEINFMTANIIDGKSIAQETIAQIKESISKNIKQGLNVPGLAVVIVGDNPASVIYVRNKRIACKEAGIKSYDHDLPIDISEEELINFSDRILVCFAGEIIGDISAKATNPHDVGSLIGGIRI